MFRFASPAYFYLLILLPVLAALYVYYVKNRERRLARFGDMRTLRMLMPEASPKRVRNKFIIVLCAMALMIVALARPQLGSKMREVEHKGIELMIAMDVSNSMLAKDFQPNRLERTKYAISRLLEGLNQDRVGLIVFAGEAYVQLPITSDYTTALNFLDHISVNSVSKQGTAIGAAIDLASRSFSSNNEGSRVLVIISDGENHEDDAMSAAKRAAEKGIEIYTIGIGTPEGSPIEIGGELIKDKDGNIVVSKLNEEMLEHIAMTTDGAYIRATNKNFGLSDIISKINEVEKTKTTSTVFEEYNEQYIYFVILALALLLLDVLMIDRKNRILARFSIFRQEEEQASE